MKLSAIDLNVLVALDALLSEQSVTRAYMKTEQPRRHELMKNVTIHTHACGEGGIFVNAYLVETASGVVAIDSTLTETESKAFRKEVEALEKPLLAVLVTHPHPEHVAGITNLVAKDSARIIATAPVIDLMRRLLTEAVERFYRAMAKERGWGDDWEGIERHVLVEVWLCPAGRLGRVEDVAHVVAFLASPAAAFCNGANYRVDGGSAGCVN